MKSRPPNKSFPFWMVTENGPTKVSQKKFETEWSLDELWYEKKNKK